jgi:hypothetical protein
MRIFGSKTNTLKGGRRKFHNEELHNLYSSPSIDRMIKWRMKRVRHIVHMREMKSVYNIFIGKSEIT